MGQALSREYDVIVLGLGALGSAAAYWSAKRGARVLGLEQFEFGHARGSSHDRSRIIRLSYFTPAYVQMAKEAYRAWASLEEDAGERLVVKTGGLDIGLRANPVQMSEHVGSMRACGVAFEELDAAEIRKRWPCWRVGDDVHGIFQADAGIVAAERATDALRRIAVGFGATLHDRTPVTSLRAAGGEIEVEAGGNRYRGDKLIVAAGAWTNDALAHLGRSLPIEVTKEQVIYFVPRDPGAFTLGEFPIWIWLDDPSFYGFPIFGEPRTVKITQDSGGKPVAAQTRDFEEDPEITARVKSFLERYLPAALGRVDLVKTCLYARTPDRDFVIDALPGHANVSVAVGDGHAFKFASLIGRILSDGAVEGCDLTPFKIARPILSRLDESEHDQRPAADR
ncbi:MAG TPA: N-methyl-L-tryptophan oxidase [Candidatus Acidoferrum sp.]|nr:N-methyl-L-tryptophan oxidase [Candidatus Acidoferrum sp.]